MTTGRRTLACLAAAAAVAATAGCGGSATSRGEAVAESYLEQRLERRQPSRASADVVVLCRPASGQRQLCGTLVTDDIVATPPVRQRWAVTLDRAGRVTGARLLSSQDDASGHPLPEVRYVLAKDAAVKAAAERRRAARERRRRRAAAARARVHLRIVPRQPVYVCIVDGRGRRRFDRITDSPVRARGRRLTVTLGSSAARVTVDGRPLAIPTSPYAFLLRPGVRRSVPLAERPCS
jgi:hypothetical protein